MLEMIKQQVRDGLHRATIEEYLDKHQMWALMRNGRYWRIRRNGRTQTWKTRPNDYRIPVKAGMKSCGEITHTSDVGVYDPSSTTWKTADFVIADGDHDPNK